MVSAGVGVRIMELSDDGSDRKPKQRLYGKSI